MARWVEESAARGRISLQDLHQFYVDWCKSAQIDPANQVWFARRLRRLGIDVFVGGRQHLSLVRGLYPRPLVPSGGVEQRKKCDCLLKFTVKGGNGAKFCPIHDRKPFDHEEVAWVS